MVMAGMVPKNELMVSSFLQTTRILTFLLIGTLMLVENSESLRLRAVPFRRHQQSFLSRRYRRLDVHEEAAGKLNTAEMPGFTNIKVKAVRSKVASFITSEPVPLDLQEESAATTSGESHVSGVPSARNLKPKVFRKNEIPSHESAVESPSTPLQRFKAKAMSPRTSRGKGPAPEPVTDVHELRRLVLDEGVELKNVPLALHVTDVTTTELLDHSVIELIAKRFHSDSTPGKRAADDTARLALSMEGGGMRGAVTAGMAAAIASLGLCDSFDAIYGSSAGSVIGAYMVSRQMCMDVYVDILPAAQRSFVCIKRLASALAVSAVDWMLSYVQDDLPQFAHKYSPGMNISFVLDGIMDETHGVRPLDLKSFRENDKKQPLRVASSYVKNHKLYTKSFGTEDFFPEDDSTESTEKGRKGLFACLQASMTVPGATGSPVPIREGNDTLPCFDAFCFEPLPYRSAVEEGATHCLVLCSRPEGFQPKVSPGVYEKAVAPLYFKSHGEPAVSRFFEKGGQQYIYAEDLLTLEEGKLAGLEKDNHEGVQVPPPKMLYGVDRDAETEPLAIQRNEWNKAHLLPLKVPIGTPELAPLEQDRKAVLEAVRGGYAAAFDLLAPAIGLQLDSELSGEQAAKLVFPDACIYDGPVLETQLRVNGDEIGTVQKHPIRRRKRDAVKRIVRNFWRRKKADDVPGQQSAPDVLLSLLPGFQAGKMAHLAGGLLSARTKH